jgi:sarcosine oxidase, subunit beta
MPQPSIAIIGAGVAGLSAALRAAELGARNVTVLEREFRAAGSSALSAGIYNVNATDALNVEVRVATRRRLLELERDNGVTLNRIGYLRLAKSEEHLELFRATIAQQKALGIEPSILIDVDGLRKIVPDVATDDLVGGIYNTDDGWMDGPQLCAAIALRAKSLGASVTQRTEVFAVERGTHARHRLRTTQGDVEADVVINAAGAWAEQVGELLGAPVPLVNQLHSTVRIKLPRDLGYVVPMTQEYIPGEDDGFYFRQDNPDTLICGRHTYSIHPEHGSEDPDDYRRAVDAEYIKTVASNVSNRLHVEGLKFSAGWTGLYPISADGQFQIGPHWADPTIIVAGGFGGNGLTSGVTLGAVAAEWAVLGETKTISRAQELLPDRPSLRGVTGAETRLASAPVATSA